MNGQLNYFIKLLFVGTMIIGQFTSFSYSLGQEISKNSKVSSSKMQEHSTMHFEKIDVFRPGENNFKIFRIPVLLVASDNSVLAFCEARKDGVADEGNIDVVIKRSEDNGKTWSDMQILTNGGNSTAGNPCPVLDKSTGIIWLQYSIDNNTIEMINSKDHGKTWSVPLDITAQVKPNEWGQGLYGPGPTNGIQLTSGRLVIPNWHKYGEDYYSHIVYSDDHGLNWKLGGSLKGGDECLVVELADGRMLINMRNEFGNKLRAISYSDDGGITWGPISEDPQLIDPVCNASILRLSTQKDGSRNRILFSNLQSSTKRENITVKLSYDECKTWPVSKRLFTGKSVYSSLALASDGMILCLYEGGENDYYDALTVVRFNLEWLTDGADSLP